MNYIGEILIEQGVKESVVGYLSYGILMIGIIIFCIMAEIIIKNQILRILARLIHKNRYHWDDILLEHRVFHRLFHILPGIIIYMFAPAFANVEALVYRGATIYILVVFLFAVNSLLDAIDEIYRAYPISNVRPIKGLLQVVKIVIFILVGIVIVGTLMNQNPLLLLSGIGALAALFSFVFKDSILGFIAGIQLTTNDMLRIGDWIEMSKYGADGNVIDITLNTIKVQNFDKTIVTLPAYVLISDSFKNWRGMTDFGGRRIKRALLIDISSITLCTPKMIENYKKINYIRDYIMEKEKEISSYNQHTQHTQGEKELINGRNLTNIGTFRAYIQFYLNNNPHLHTSTPPMVRQLPPTENGLPLEIYAFTKDTDWSVYESIQADIFDHIISIAKEFDLRIYQHPTGYDMERIGAQ